jgi:hypothetical protein
MSQVPETSWQTVPQIWVEEGSPHKSPIWPLLIGNWQGMQYWP